MSGKKGNKDTRRMKRIQELREAEQERQTGFEELNRLTRDISHHAHYDSVQKDRAASAMNLRNEILNHIQRLQELVLEFGSVRIDLDRHHTECELELKHARGIKPPPETSISAFNDDAAVQQLGNALRVLKILENALHPEEQARQQLPDYEAIHESCLAQITDCEGKITAFSESISDLREIFRIKIERGWMSEGDLEPFRQVLDGTVERLMKEMVNERRSFVTDCAKDCYDLTSRIRALDAAIDAERRR